MAVLDSSGSAIGLRTEISNELAAVLAAVADASGEDGGRYDARVCRSLIQTIAARSYGRPLLELAYLVAAADRLSGRHGYVGFFWTMRVATAGAFRAAALSAAGRGTAPREIDAATDELVISFPGQAYRISYSRMPFLAALLDFCITALGFAEIDGDISVLLSGPRDREAMQSFANGLSRRLYEFLKQHLPSQQYERKFNTICGFISERTGRRAGADAIDDRTVLAFWEERCADRRAGSDFRGFRTVAVNFFHLREALKTAADRLAVEAAAPIGPARDAGEVDPGEICRALEVADSKRSVLADLSLPPANQLKTINKSESARLELVVEAGDAAAILPLTILRAECFGSHQARIVQAVRRGRMAGPDGTVAALVAQPPVEDYGAATAAFQVLAERVQKIRQALMFILFRNGDPEAFEIGFDIFPEIVPALRARVNDPEAELAGNVVPLHPDREISRLLKSAVDGDPETLVEAALFRRARLAFMKVNRRGFEEERVCNPEIREAARASEPLLRVCCDDLAALLRALDRHFSLIPADRVFEEDCRRFQAALAALYGEPV
ncbi:hypothetical protein [Nisaea sp.]|uniref:hypothetical protein n=1 Tax=Nisaea sp. TaxID=2024842 RepID=UPI0032F04A07